MRFHVLYRPKFQAPPEQLPAMFEGAQAWKERHQEHIEVDGLFPGQGGGFGIVDVPDVETLQQMLGEMPFTPFAEVEIHPMLDAQTGWARAKELMEQQLQAMAG
jgi:muconolactone delta-isomerase